MKCEDYKRWLKAKELYQHSILLIILNENEFIFKYDDLKNVKKANLNVIKDDGQFDLGEVIAQLNKHFPEVTLISLRKYNEISVEDESGDDFANTWLEFSKSLDALSEDIVNSPNEVQVFNKLFNSFKLFKSIILKEVDR